MSEQVQEVEQQQEVQVPSVSQSLQQAVWDDKPFQSVEPAAQVEKPVQEAASANEPTKEEEEILDPKDWLKRELEVDDIAIIKAEREEYKKLKEAKPEELKFENEDSKKLHELFRQGKWKEANSIIQKQERIDELYSAEVNKDTAADIIKLNMELKYPTLTKQQLEFQYKQEYGIPKEPVMKDTEDETEFQERHQAWEETVANIQMKAEIAATMAKPELAAAKSKLVLPDIVSGNANQVAEPTQEELEASKNLKESFLKSVESSINTFNGFNVSVKDKDVDLSASYSLSPEEKAIVGDRLKAFAESGFDANIILADRWVNPDGKSLNVLQMAEDLSRVFAGDKPSQKLASDIANQRLELYLKEKKNINVNGISNGTTFNPEEKSTTERLQESFWGN